MTTMEHALELFPRDIEAIAAEAGLPQFASHQILDWIYQKQIDSTQYMTNIANVNFYHSEFNFGVQKKSLRNMHQMEL